jgi:hypothetical protein
MPIFSMLRIWLAITDLMPLFIGDKGDDADYSVERLSSKSPLNQ